MPKKMPLRLDRKKGLYLKSAGIKGRGVFCTRPIRAGEILEVTPAVILNEKATAKVDETLLNNYTFTVGDLSAGLRARAGLKKSGKASCVIMGLITFCNHSQHPNAEVLWEERGGTLYHYLRATRDIPKNTEICTTYGEGWFDDRK